MPKIKKIRSAALASQSARHEPLGQTIQDDENRNKYASTRGIRRRSGLDEGEDDNIQLLDEKSSDRILKLSKEQRFEVEAEEEMRRQKSRREGKSDMVEPDSDDEEEEDDEGLLDVEGEE